MVTPQSQHKTAQTDEPTRLASIYIRKGQMMASVHQKACFSTLDIMQTIEESNASKDIII